ncbi:MAG: signal peptidase I [Candidatus Bathyarchaeota archaeon]|jgi:signal peptidase|nr:MAG: signal peptidase I [Candidatus Bathyarchaeota archaeon]
MSRLRAALRNEYVKSLILLAIVLAAIVGVWFGLRAYLRTEYPMLAVASGSMVPTLNKGDLIVVQGGMTIDDIVAEPYPTGDIIVFHKPYDPEDLIVHRAVDKQDEGENTYLVTKGDDNNGNDPWRIHDDDLVGKVVWSIPYLGHIPLFVHTPIGITVIAVLIVVLVFVEFVIPLSKEKEKEETQVPKEEAETPKEEADSPKDE